MQRQIERKQTNCLIINKIAAKQTKNHGFFQTCIHTNDILTLKTVQQKKRQFKLTKCQRKGKTRLCIDFYINFFYSFFFFIAIDCHD